MRPEERSDGRGGRKIDPGGALTRCAAVLCRCAVPPRLLISADATDATADAADAADAGNVLFSVGM